MPCWPRQARGGEYLSLLPLPASSPPAAPLPGQAHDDPSAREGSAIPHPHTRPWLPSTLPRGLCLPLLRHLPSFPLPVNAPSLHVLEKQPQIPEVETPASLLSPVVAREGLSAVSPMGLGRWDPGAMGLLRCEGTALICPKVSSILGSGQWAGDSCRGRGFFVHLGCRDPCPPKPGRGPAGTVGGVWAAFWASVSQWEFRERLLKGFTLSPLLP